MKSKNRNRRTNECEMGHPSLWIYEATTNQGVCVCVFLSFSSSLLLFLSSTFIPLSFEGNGWRSHCGGRWRWSISWQDNLTRTEKWEETDRKETECGQDGTTRFKSSRKMNKVIERENWSGGWPTGGTMKPQWKWIWSIRQMKRKGK